MKGFNACLLAAGRGRRAGGPKAWRWHLCRSLLERQVDFLKRLIDPERISVTIQEGWMDRCRRIDPDIKWVPENPDAPPLSALQGLLRAGSGRGWIFVHHVDMPVWQEGLFKSLASFAAEGIDAVVPVFEGRGGHPVLLSPQAAAEISELDSSRHRLDHWLRAHRVKRPIVPYRTVLENWNA